MRPGFGLWSPSNARTGTKVMMIAGEVSGDQQAGRLARELLRLSPDLYLYGAGGEEMRAAGVDVRIFSVHLGCVGITESLRMLRPARKLFAELNRLVEEEPPDMAVLVDNELFNARLADSFVEHGVPVVFYYPPQVWLWGRSRAKRIAALADLILPAFEQEAEVYRQVGARVKWSGHPLLDSLQGVPASDWECREAGLDPKSPMLALLPGSRIHELERLTPILVQAARLVREVHPDMQIVITVSASIWEPLIRSFVSCSGLDRVVLIPAPAYGILRRCSLAIAKAGTGSLELALLGVPNMVTYRIGPLSYLGAWLIVRTRFVAMANILANRQIVREFRQSGASAENLAAEALRILADVTYADRMRYELAKIRDQLGRPGAIHRSAECILEVLHERVGANLHGELCVG